MTQALTSVWTEIQVDDEAISLSLISESQDGARVEETTRLPFDELENMSGEIENLSLSNETRANLSDVQSTLDQYKMQEFLDESNTLSEGDTAIDANPPSWADEARVEIVNITDKSADEYVMYKNQFEYDDTVATANPSCDPDETVIEAKYLDFRDQPTGRAYAFPESRLEKETSN